MSSFRKLLHKIKHRIAPLFANTSSVAYWEKRAREYGIRSVIHLGHSAEEMEELNNRQRDLLFPLLKRELTGKEKVVLDFGCGPGRFTRELAELINGDAIGTDPIQYLLDLAPTNNNTRFLLMLEGRIPMDNNEADIAWICLVLGSITSDSVMNDTIAELYRVIKPGGLIFVVEKTSEDRSNYKTKSVDYYEQLFRQFNLKKISEYQDLEDCNSVFIGRKPH